MALAAVVLPVIAGAALYAIDHVAVTQQTGALQKAADTAAIAAARELHFIQTGGQGDDGVLDAVAESYARQHMPGTDLTADATADGSRFVDVELALKIRSPLGQVFGTEQTLTARARAEIYGAQNICIITLDRGTTKPGINMEGQAEIKAGDCGLYVNALTRDSVRTRDSSYIEADFVCTAGGHDGNDHNVSTDIVEDCQSIKDPLENRYFPPATPCNPSFPTYIGENETVNLTPGTYCGGLRISRNASVWFAPGIYYFDNGPLIVEDTASAKGEYVNLFFEDEMSWFEFRDDAEIDFSAPKTGPMAGITAATRSLCPGTRCLSPRTFVITSAKVRSLLGTIYMPLDDLTIDTTMPVSEEAAFTILIVDNLFMQQSPALVLNTDYASTSVPVPEGLTGNPSTRIVE